MTQDPISLPARARRLARLRGDIPKHFPLKRFRAGAVVADGFTTTKTEKRMIKRSVFMGNVASRGEAAREATATITAKPKTKTQTDTTTSSSTPSSTTTAPTTTSMPRTSTKTPSILRARSSGIKKRSSAAPRTSSSSSTAKTRRPSKKLVTTLTALADALPELSSDLTGAGAAGGGTVLEGVERGKVRHQSLPSKTGALKKKEMVVRGEMERFGVSLARLVGPRGREVGGVKEGGMMDTDDGGRPEWVQDAAAPVVTGRWQALRGYITSTMERNPAFISQ